MARKEHGQETDDQKSKLGTVLEIAIDAFTKNNLQSKKVNCSKFRSMLIFVLDVKMIQLE